MNVILIDKFIKLGELIISALQQKRVQRQQIFKEIVEPLYLELGPIVDDYYLLLKKSRKLIERTHPGQRIEIIDEIRGSRDSMHMARVKVFEIVNEIKSQVNDKRLNRFLDKAIDLFTETTTIERSKHMSKGGELVELCEYAMHLEIPNTEVVRLIDGIIENLESTWKSLSQIYASLRFYSLKP